MYLVGIRLDPGSPGPQFFTLIAHDGNAGRPLVVNGRILFFSTPALASHVAQIAAQDSGSSGSNGGALSMQNPPLSGQIDVLCDVAESLFLVNSQAEDADGVLLDCIDFLDDLVRATELSVPATYMAVLNTLAERLEQNPEFGSYLDEHGIDRESIEDAIMWCVGAVAVKSTWVG